MGERRIVCSPPEKASIVVLSHITPSGMSDQPTVSARAPARQREASRTKVLKVGEESLQGLVSHAMGGDREIGTHDTPHELSRDEGV